MKIFESKYYPRMIYLALVITILLIFFNSISILDSINNKLQTRTMTGFVIDNITNIINTTLNSNLSINNSSHTQEVYSMNSYIMYYLVVVSLIVGILLTFIILNSTIKKNIEQEEKEREF